MKQSKHNPEQIAELLTNRHIAKCSSKSISYSKDFKILAVRQYAEGMSAAQIFKTAGLGIDLVGKYAPDNCLRDWRRIAEVRGLDALKTENRGLANGNKGRPKTKGLTDADRIKRLEIENAYLKAKYDFLVKLRAQRKS